MSIIIGGPVSAASKNVWKIDDDLTTIEDSANLNSSATTRVLRQDAAGSFYAAVNDKIAKIDSSLDLDTTWGDGNSGLIDAGNVSLWDMDITSAGNMAMAVGAADGGGVDYFDTDGDSVWDSALAGTPTPTGLAFDLAINSLWTWDDNNDKFVKINRADNSTTSYTLAGFTTGSIGCSGILIDRVNFGTPSHLYLQVSKVAGNRTLFCFDPDNFGAGAIWSTTTNMVGGSARNTGLAIDSAGNLYIVGARVNSVSVLKINPNTGAIVASFDTGANTLAIAINSSDKIFVVGSKSGNKCVWRLDTDLTEEASLSTTVLDVNTESLAVGAPSGAVVAPKDVKYTRRLVAIAKDEVWHETPAGTMAVVSDSQSGGLDFTKPLVATEAFQKVFIANASVLKVTEFVNTRLVFSTAAVAVSDVPAHGAIISSKNRAAAMVVDFVQPVTSLVVSAVYGYTTTSLKFIAADSVAWDGRSIGVVSAVTGASLPFFHDYTVYPSVSTTPKTFGSLPGRATLIALYRGRIVLAGNPAYPFQWYMSRQNNPYDFAYFANDPQAPVAGGNADAGELGDVVTALIPYKDDYLVFGCANTIWVMRGDPAVGGSLDEVSLTTGVFGPMSHCWDDRDNLYFFGTAGIYRIPPGFGPPENLTAGLLPNIVADLGVDPSTHRIVMAYDRRRLGVLIAITTLATGSNVNYWFDLKTEGFFPETYPEEGGVYAALYYEARDSDYRRLLLGGRDAYIRYFKDSAKDDDAGDSNDAISSYHTFGPIQLAQDADREGKIISLTVITGTDTDGLSYDVHVADSAEETIDQVTSGSTPFLTGTVQVDNRVARIRVKCRGIYALIKLYNSTASQSWSIEKVVAQVTEGGRR